MGRRKGDEGYTPIRVLPVDRDFLKIQAALKQQTLKGYVSSRLIEPDIHRWVQGQKFVSVEGPARGDCTTVQVTYEAKEELRFRAEALNMGFREYVARCISALSGLSEQSRLVQSLILKEVGSEEPKIAA